MARISMEITPGSWISFGWNSTFCLQAGNLDDVAVARLCGAYAELHKRTAAAYQQFAEVAVAAFEALRKIDPELTQLAIDAYRSRGCRGHDFRSIVWPGSEEHLCRIGSGRTRRGSAAKRSGRSTGFFDFHGHGETLRHNRLEDEPWRLIRQRYE